MIGVIARKRSLKVEKKFMRDQDRYWMNLVAEEDPKSLVTARLLEPSEAPGPCQHFNFGVQASKTVRE